MRGLLLQTPGETQRSMLQRICCRWTLLGRLLPGPPQAQPLPRDTAVALVLLRAAWCRLGACAQVLAVKGAGEGCAGIQLPSKTLFVGEDTSHFIQVLFSLSPFCPSPTSLACSLFFLLSSSYFEFPAHVEDAAFRPSTHLSLTPRSEPSSVRQSWVLCPCT